MERVLGNLSTAPPWVFFHVLDLPLKAEYDTAVLVFVSCLHSCHLERAWQGDEIDGEERCEQVLHCSPSLNKCTEPAGAGSLQQDC